MCYRDCRKRSLTAHFALGIVQQVLSTRSGIQEFQDRAMSTSHRFAFTYGFRFEWRRADETRAERML
jgi:hypothetical protein